MREVTPYKTLRGAVRALDNGGRFYNLFAKADDQVVDAGELARAAGASGDRAILFFEMALMALPAEERSQVRSLLSPALLAKCEERRPAILAPSAVEAVGEKETPTIVTGYPVFVEDKTQFAGFIVLVTPVIALIPIMDQFDVYEVFDTPGRREPRTVIATTRGSKRLDGIHARFGGVLKELQFDDKTGKEHGLYLETAYYTPLG